MDSGLAGLRGREELPGASSVSDLAGSCVVPVTVDMIGDMGYEDGGDTGLQGRLGGGDLGGTLGVVSIGIALSALSRLALSLSSSSSRIASHRR